MNSDMRGLVRFARDLPVVDEYVTLGEGDTPLVPLKALTKRLHMGRISAKLESHNPTGSFKDRVAAMSISLALTRGKQGWIAASSGSTGMALAAYGARAGLPGLLCLLPSTPGERRLPLLPYGVRVIDIEGAAGKFSDQTVSSLLGQVETAAERHGLYVGTTSHSFNHDGMRGLDTIGYELAEQAPKASHVYVPTGGGGLMVAIARGLRFHGSKARMIACQPAGCAPIVYFLSGVSSSPNVYLCESTIGGLQVSHPADGRLAAEAVRKSGGWGTVAGDDEIYAAQRLLASTEGIFVEPAGAAALAALLKDLESGRIDATGHQILILSGAGWRDLGRLPGPDSSPAVPVGDVHSHVDDWAAGLAEKSGQS